MRDVRRTPTQETADWVEYAIKHDGALFNQVAAVHLGWVQRNLLDVYAFLGAVVVLILYVGRIVLTCTARVVRRGARRLFGILMTRLVKSTRAKLVLPA